MTTEQLDELDEALAEAHRGEGIPWEAVRAELFTERVEVLALWHGARGQPPPGL